MIPIPKNKLQEQFEFEKSQLEKYGFVSTLTFEEWLRIKEENNKIMNLKNKQNEQNKDI